MMVEEKIKLIVLTEEMPKDYLDFVHDFRDAGEQFPPVPYEEFDVATHLKELANMAKGINLPEGWVPMQVYWLTRNSRIIGECGLRNELTDALRKFGGHIGYSIRPSERNKGYGTKMVKLAMEKARGLGIDRVLITCDKDNIASQRVIQKNGGVLDSESFSEQAGRITQRYWIDLGLNS